MEEKILETLISSFVGELAKESKSILEGISDESKQFLKIGIKKYLEKQKDKYSYIKTLLKGNTPTYLYNIYYHLKLSTDKINHIETKSITKLLEKNKYITIVGDAGSGKSTLTKHLFLNAIYEKKGIPVLVELRYLNDYNNKLETYIYEKIFENKLTENVKILERFLEHGKFIFFLDGFDELNADIKIGLIDNLNSFIQRYDNNSYILTTRPYSDIENLPLFHNYSVEGLTIIGGEIEGFIFKQLHSEKELAIKIVNSIKNNASPFIESFLKNPLLLSLYILTFQSNAEVPDKKYIFYRRVINALFSEHDSKTKLGFVREKLSGLNQEKFENILRVFCFLSYFDGKISWDSDYANDKLRMIKQKKSGYDFDNYLFIKDLKSAVALWVDDNGELSFAHRSLQEYFAAAFIRNLNSIESEKVYQKIIVKFTDVRRFGEVENFLSLCKEMDNQNFTKYYLLPLFYELRQLINNENNESLVKSFIQFFVTSISLPYVEKNRGKNREISYFDRQVNINNQLVYRSIYIHLPFTRELFRVLDETLRKNEDIEKCKFISKEEEVSVFNHHTGSRDLVKQKMRVIELTQEVPNDFYSLCNSQVLDIAQRFDKFIDTEIYRYENLVKANDEFNSDLVSLI
ncbi:NACHT domain-containing protein [Spirosoma oryzae]|uniref:NACHT domain-containing protein n=1 Tax=Spirosoma oryzae TaxID=1469603 RepID=A0A2T0SLW9_9BACT|nr:NACHT domain-containing protein [Spirosoma oryzae]PRY34398.1 NACHT domain-containing protein [Spirosoma oryzae]